jgi:hypothetical protein
VLPGRAEARRLDRAAVDLGERAGLQVEPGGAPVTEVEAVERQVEVNLNCNFGGKLVALAIVSELTVTPSIPRTELALWGV